MDGSTVPAAARCDRGCDCAACEDEANCAFPQVYSSSNTLARSSNALARSSNALADEANCAFPQNSWLVGRDSAGRAEQWRLPIAHLKLAVSKTALSFTVDFSPRATEARGKRRCASRMACLLLKMACLLLKMACLLIKIACLLLKMACLLLKMACLLTGSAACG